MKKRLFLLIFLPCVVVVGMVIFCCPQIPSEDKVLEVIQKAEEVYRFSDGIVPVVPGRIELMLYGDPKRVHFYDEVQNYDENVSKIFTKDGISELEGAYQGKVPWIFKREGKTYRISPMTEADFTVYFPGRYNPNPANLRLLNRTWNSFTYEVSTTPEGSRGSWEPITVIITVALENGTLKMDQFSYPACYQDEGYYTKSEMERFQFNTP